MMTFFVFFMTILTFLTLILGYRNSNGLNRPHVNEEWTQFDKDGKPVCGVGQRGYWSNKATYGDWKLRQRKDGTWYDPENPDVKYVSMTLEELMKREKIDA